VKQLSEQSSRLARQEVELAKAELAVKGKRAGIGAGIFGGAGAFGKHRVEEAAPPVPEQATEGVKEDVQRRGARGRGRSGAPRPRLEPTRRRLRWRG